MQGHLSHIFGVVVPEFQAQTQVQLAVFVPVHLRGYLCRPRHAAQALRIRHIKAMEVIRTTLDSMLKTLQQLSIRMKWEHTTYKFKLQAGHVRSRWLTSD
jgi:hypothetical protein